MKENNWKKKEDWNAFSEGSHCYGNYWILQKSCQGIVFKLVRGVLKSKAPEDDRKLAVVMVEHLLFNASGLQRSHKRTQFRKRPGIYFGLRTTPRRCSGLTPGPAQESLLVGLAVLRIEPGLVTCKANKHLNSWTMSRPLMKKNLYETSKTTPVRNRTDSPKETNAHLATSQLSSQGYHE